MSRLGPLRAALRRATGHRNAAAGFGALATDPDAWDAVARRRRKATLGEIGAAVGRRRTRRTAGHGDAVLRRLFAGQGGAAGDAAASDGKRSVRREFSGSTVK